MSDKKSRGKRGPSLDDVARVAGVNRVTASVALRGVQAGTRVSEATRQRILDVARELGYTPSAIALAFRQQRTDLIGFYAGHSVFDPHLPFSADVINGLQRGCEKHQQDLLMFGSFTRRSTNEIYTALASGKIDGLVVLPTPTNPVIERLVRSHLPAVAITNVVPGIPAVLADDAQGSRLLVEYLAGKGHRRALYRADPISHTSPSLRRQAFLQAADAFGLEVVLSPPEGWYGAMTPLERDLLSGPAQRRPTAAVCWADTNAYAFLVACREMGLRVPDDIAIVGFDGIPTMVPPLMQLTTIRAPWVQVAETAVDLVVALIGGGEVVPETTFPVELLVGETA